MVVVVVRWWLVSAVAAARACAFGTAMPCAGCDCGCGCDWDEAGVSGAWGGVMKEPERARRATTTLFVWAYGNETLSPIYENLCNDSAQAGCSYQAQLGLYLAILGVTVHVILSYALNINPFERAVRHVYLTLSLSLRD